MHYFRLITLLLLSNAPFMNAQTSADQGLVVGNLDYTLPAGNSVWVPPFVAEDTFSGRIESITFEAGQGNSIITLNTGDLPFMASHYLEICDGPETGLALDITETAQNTISISGNASDFGIEVGHKVILREHLTVAGLLPNGANFAPFQDTVSVFNTDGSRLDLFWNPISGNWMDATNGTHDDQQIRPGQGVLLFLSQELTITLGGSGAYTHVKTTPTRIAAHPDAVNLVGPVSPFPEGVLLSDIGFIGDLTPFLDSVSFFSEDGTFTPDGTFLSEGGSISSGDPVFIDGTGENASSVMLTHCEAAVVNIIGDEPRTIGLAAPQIGTVVQ